MALKDIEYFLDKRSPESKAAAEQRMKEYTEGKAKSMEQFNANMQKIGKEHDAKMDKLNTALDRAGVPLPKKDTFPKTTAAFEEVARSDKERFDRKAEKTSGGGGGGIPSDKMDKMKKMNYKAGGKVSSASKRADGCAIKGKTKGRIV